MSNIASRTPRTYGYYADGDLSGKLYHFVKVGSKVNSVAPVTSVNDVVIGIIQGFRLDGTDGDSVDVALPGGGAFLAVAGAIAPGGEVKTDNAGKGVAVTTAGDRIGAIVDAADGNTAANDVVAVEVTHPYHRHA